MLVQCGLWHRSGRPNVTRIAKLSQALHTTITSGIDIICDTDFGCPTLDFRVRTLNLMGCIGGRLQINKHLFARILAIPHKEWTRIDQKAVVVEDVVA
eukprot:scaffold87624_cov18-Prasinocladus_malaysianus.AAC.1